MDPTIREYQHPSDLTEELRRLADHPMTRFLVPGGADRELLLDLLYRHRPLFGSRPRIWQWKDLYRELGDERVRAGAPVRLRRQIDPPDHALILRHLVEALRRGQEDRLPPGVLRRGFLSLLGENLRELLREEVEPEHLQAALECEECDEGCPDPSHPGQVLCRLYRDYRHYLDRQGLADSASVATLARELAEASSDPWEVHLVFVGFLSFTHGQGSLIRALLRRGVPCTLMKPWTGLPGLLDAADQFGVSPAPPQLRPLALPVLEAGDRRFELESLARELALWAREDPETFLPLPFPGFEGVGVAVDPSRGEALCRELERYGVPCSLRGGGSVKDTDLGRLPRLCADAAGGDWPTERTLGLLSLPCLGGEDFPVSEVRAAAPCGEAEWRRFLRDRPEDRSRFEALRGFAAALREGAPPLDLLRRLEALCAPPEPGSRLAALAEEDPDRDGAVRRWQGAYGELRRKILSLEEATPPLGPAATEPLAGGDAVAFLETWAEEAQTPQDLPRRGAVTVYPGTPPVLAEHPWFVLTGVTSAVWPGPLKESPLLADPDRRRVNGLEARDLGLEPTHLPVLSEVRVQREALFRRVVCAGRTGTLLTRPLQDAQGRPLGPSPFEETLRPLLDPGIPRMRRRPLSELIPSRGALFPQEAPLPETRVFRGVGGSSPAEGRGEPEPRGRFSLLDRFVSCPFAAWCDAALELRPSPPGRYDVRRAGLALHELWQRVWSSGASCREEAARDRFEEVFRHPDRGYPELLEDPALERHRARLLRQVQALGARMDGQEERLEEVGSREGTLLESLRPRLVRGSVTFDGRCDRADLWRTPQGVGAVLLDYKMGTSRNYGKHLQLPAYAAALLEDPPEGFEIPVVGYGYLCLGDGGFAGRFAEGYESLEEAYRGVKPRRGPLSFASQIDTALEALGDMASALEAGRYPARYDSPGCSGCPYPGLCRRGEARSEGIVEEPEGGEDRD